MTSSSSLSKSSKANNPSRSKLLRFVQSHVIETVAASVAVSFIMLGGTTWNVWTTYQGFRNSVSQQFKLRTLSDQIVHLDEVLTMSARMAASTGDLAWEVRYKSFEPELISAIEQVTKLSPKAIKANQATDTANERLIEMETKAFALIRQEKASEAFKLLLSKEYDTQKQIYTEGVNQTIGQINADVEASLNQYSGRLRWAVTLSVLSFGLLVVGWSLILILIRTYIRTQAESEQALLQSRETLEQSKTELLMSQENLTLQEHQTRQENTLLQDDIGHILDVVSDLEDGNFTTQAQVNDRATGLVADTLNRLIEELGRVIATVSITAQQVGTGAEAVENLATKTSCQAQAQVDGIKQVQVLMHHVNTLAQETLNYAQVSSESLKTAQVALLQGETEMQGMSQGINSLQDGATQIVRRVETLNDFVDMATHFVQAQKRVASLTRVLAFNASTVASRATEQQDPEQFASVAQEFATIASQVNDLATQTNQSLVALQQRTDQIQTAVTGINQDTQEINTLVTQFTQNVDHSQVAIGRIKVVTEQVTTLGQQVTESSQAIANAANNTLNTVKGIVKTVAKTEQQSKLTRNQAEQMGQLSQQLLTRMEFFQVPALPDLAETSPALGASNDVPPPADSDSPSAILV
jgi:methyl-accepting chemotaxis protein PixJ